MKIILLLMTIVTGVQLYFCHLSLWFLMSLIARLLFAARRVGAIIPVKRLVITEGVGLAFMLLFYILFKKGAFPVMRAVINVVCCLAACGIMVYDDVTYVYDTVDVEE